jgi:hypothetical protein
MLGVWMWPESVRRRGAESVFALCRRAGVTDVYFLTKGLAGTAAFLTPLTPPVDPERDLLREALDAAHGRGIRLHAWFTSASDRRFREEHPASALTHYSKGPHNDVVSIADPDYLGYMRSVLSDLTARYEVDGVHLDYIRYNHLIYGWSESDRTRMTSRGVDLGHVGKLMEDTFYSDDPAKKDAIFQAFRDGDEDVLRLAESRRADVLSFARALAETVRSSDKGISLSAALMPEGAFDELAFSDLHYGQHYADLAPLMDCLLPMAYSRAYGKGGAWVREAAVGTAKHGVPVLVGVHAYEGATGLTLREDTASCEGIPGVEGVCLFREGASVWTFLRGRSLCVFNPLSTPVTALRITAGEETVRIPCRIEQDEEQEFSVPFRPDSVQAFAEAREVCAALFADKDGD